MIGCKARGLAAAHGTLFALLLAIPLIEYRNDDVGLTSKADQSDLDFWAAGVVQNVEKADTSFYAVCRHYAGDIVQSGAATKTSLDDFDVLISGAKINF